ncbi:MAG: glycosyltransferase family 2 protein [Kouleothrix sp.]|nr:glycosyltransferase family 2 protein [Kouleothrix sp.]
MSARPVAEQPAPSLSVVIPIYDEEENVALLYERLTGALATIASYEIIAVDDGSRDRSFALLRDLARDDRRLRVVRLRRNFGQTAAFTAGFERARGQVVVTIDADLQNDPADIPRLLEKIDEGYDVVSGWRARRQDPFWNRRLPSIIANRLISWVTGLQLHDYGCSLKAYRREVVQDLQLYGELHRFIPAIASWQGVTVAELPVNHAPRRYGKSKYGIGRTLRVILDLLTVRFLLSYATRPMQIFGLLGILFGGLGGLILGYLGFVRVVLAQPISDRPLTLLGLLLMVLGMQFISIGLLGEMIVRSMGGGQNAIYRVREELNGDDQPSG